MDIHFPHLNVDETLSFAIACRASRSRPGGISREKYIKTVRDILATVFGLRHTYKTKVGNDYIRGVSGGERKRVSIAEALAARASVYCWDNATRGLDSSTALEFARAIRTSTNIMDNVAIVAAYQAGENIYKTFDKVTVLYNGKQVYFGPVTRAKEYFEEMGYACAPRQCTAEFLTAVTDPNGRFPREGMKDKVPRTADDFVKYWKDSEDYKSLQEDMREYDANSDGAKTYQRYRESMTQEKMKHQRSKSQFNITFYHQFKLCVKRGFQKIIHDRAYTMVDIGASFIQSFIIGSMFYNTSDTTSGTFPRGGALYFALLFYSICCLAELAPAFESRSVLLKQKSYMFYHPAAEELATLFCDIPIKLVGIVIFTLVTYFLVGLRLGAGQFFIYFLFLALSTFVMSALFHAIATVGKSMFSANAIAGIFVIAIAIYTGYVLQSSYMHPWFKWLSYINPIRYAFESLMANEFHSREMECGGSLVPSGPLYLNVSSSNQVCASIGSELGKSTVSGDRYISVAFGYHYSNEWRNLGIIIAFWVLFVFLAALGCEYIRPVAIGGDKLLFKRGHIPKEFLHDSKYELPSKDIEKGKAQSNESEEVVIEGKVADVEELKHVFGESGYGSEIFSWKHVDYVIPIEDGTRKLLDDVQGYVKPGKITALVGESGAGKTTLLNVLSQRTDFGVITGSMLVDGKPVDASFQRRTGYVQQQDIHISELSVRESLIFSARLRQQASIKDSEKLEYVEKILHLLGMETYANAVVGEPGRGLNVEQRKKLSIAVELVAKPSLLLFLDEPTSGLDSQSAWAIVQFIKQLAAAGQAILCTIHQPSATLFEQFDRLLLLKKGGQTVYFGDIGKNSQNVIDYFEKKGAPRCRSEENPAEYILDCIGAGATAAVDQDWAEVWRNSEECAQATKEVDEIIETYGPLPSQVIDSSLGERYAASWFKQLKLVTLRTHIQFWRDPVYVGCKFGLLVVAGLFLGFTFWDIDHTVIGMQNLLFAVFISLLISAPLINQVQDKALAARELYEVRESKSGTFHWSVMILAQNLSEIPYNFFGFLLAFFCFYFPMKVGYGSEKIGYFFLMYTILFQTYISTFGLLVIYIAPDLPSAEVIGALLLSFMVSFCGVLQYKDLLPGFWIFMYRLSPYTYFVQSFVGIVLHDFEVQCAENEIAYFAPPVNETCLEFAGPFVSYAGGKIMNPEATDYCEYCKYSIGDEYLATVGIKYSQRWRNFGFIWAYIIFNICASLVLYYVLRVIKWDIQKIKNKILFWKPKKFIEGEVVES